MEFTAPLVSAKLLRRYKRFLADVELPDGQTITAHCANPGSMLGLQDPGTRVWLEPNNDPKKKLKYGWRLVEHANGHFTGVDTSVPNRAVKKALIDRAIPELEIYTSVRSEVKYGKNSRIDFLLGAQDLPDLYLEVKSVTLSRQSGLAEFPDSVTARGTKHLIELANVVRAGHSAMMFYLVQRTDAERVAIAGDIDPAYAEAFAQTRAAGVSVLAYRCDISPKRVSLDRPLPFLT